MAAHSDAPPTDHRVFNVLWKSLAWALCVATVVAIGVLRARANGGGASFQQGYATASIVVAFAVAFAIGLPVHRFVRHRRGVPPWIGLIAVAVSGCLMLLDVGRDSVAQAACAPVASTWGSAPGAWTYVEPTDAERTAILRKADMEGDAGVDLKLARNGEAMVLLLAVEDGGSSFVEGVKSGADKAGATRARAPYDATVLDYPNGARTATAVKGCNGVLITGAVSDVDTVARAVFG